MQTNDENARELDDLVAPGATEDANVKGGTELSPAQQAQMALTPSQQTPPPTNTGAGAVIRGGIVAH